MALVKTIDGAKILIQVGDGATPEVFAHECLINAERSFALKADGNDVTVPDCDNPTAPAWRQRVIDVLSATISGGGKLHTTSAETYFNWLTSGAAKNVRVKIDTTGENGGGYFAGSFKLTAFSISGVRTDKANCEITLESDGVIAWTDAA